MTGVVTLAPVPTSPPGTLPAAYVDSFAVPVAYAAGINAQSVRPATSVTYNGSFYVCVTAHTTTATFDSGKWLQIVSKGSPGDNVSNAYGLLAAFSSWRAACAAIDQNIGTARAIHMSWGDSWKYRAMITGPLGEALKQRYGDAGVGYFNAAGAGYPTYWPASVTWAKSGTWTVGSYGLDLASAISSQVGATTTMTAICQTMVVIYRKRAGGGTFTYAVNGGAATAVDTSVGSGVGALTISGLTLGVNSIVFAVTVAGSTGVEISGVDFRIEARGVRIHRLGVPGSQATGVPAVLSSADITAMIQALGPPTSADIMFGTNEQNVNVVPGDFTSSLAALVAQFRAAAPNMDLAIASPSDNGVTGKTYTMAQYAAAAQVAAVANGCSYIPVYEGMGSYASMLVSGAFVSTDTTHPTAQGAQAIASIYLRYLVDAPVATTISTMGIRNLWVGQNAARPAFYGSGAAGPGAGLINGTDNVVVTTGAGSKISTGTGITLCGSQTGNALQTQTNVCGFGISALQLSTASNTAAFGGYSFQHATTATLIVGIGPYTGYQTTTGNRIFAGGSYAVYSNVDGSNIVAAGDSAAFSSQHDSNIVAFGTNALLNANGGGANIAVGPNSLYDTTTGDKMLGFGNIRGVTTGRANLLMGNMTGLPSSLSNALVFADGDGNIRADYNKSISGGWSLAGGLKLPVYTFATLPSAAAVGANFRAAISDAPASPAFLAAAAGGGSTFAPVVTDGASTWRYAG